MSLFAVAESHHATVTCKHYPTVTANTTPLLHMYGACMHAPCRHMPDCPHPWPWPRARNRSLFAAAERQAARRRRLNRSPYAGNGDDGDEADGLDSEDDEEDEYDEDEDADRCEVELTLSPTRTVFAAVPGTSNRVLEVRRQRGGEAPSHAIFQLMSRWSRDDQMR